MSTKLIKTILSLLVLGLFTTAVLSEMYPVEISKIMIFGLQAVMGFFFGYFIGEYLFININKEKYDKK